MNPENGKDFDHGGYMVCTVYRPDQPEPGQWIKFHDAGVEVAIARAPKGPDEEPLLPHKTHVFVRKLRPGKGAVSQHTWKISDEGLEHLISEEPEPSEATEGSERP